MLILLEGCDKTGKTTIANDLMKMFPGAVQFKNTIKPEDNKPVTIGLISGIYLGAYQFALQDQKMHIFDRSHITEIVYSARRGYEANQNVDWLHWEETFLAKRALIVYTSAPKAVIEQRFKKDKEDYVDASEIGSILERYDDYLSQTKLPVIKVSSLNDVLSNRNIIFKAIDERRRFYNYK